MMSEKKSVVFRKLIRKIRYEPVDWFRIIADLKVLGFSHEAIAYAIDVDNHKTISSYACGVNPRYENGEKLIDLWRRETNKHHPPRVQSVRC